MNQTKGKLAQYLHEFWKYRDLLKLLVTKNIKLKYRRSWLGYVWSILNPLMIMAVMTVVFSTMFKRNIENFPVYLFCGQLLFNYMNTATSQSTFSITSNAALLKKTYVPKYLFTLARVTSGLVDLCFSLGALVIVILVTRARVTWYILLFPLVLLQLYVFCVGLGLFLAQASVFFKDTQFIYSAVTTAWTYLTPIFYPIEALPEQLRWCIQHFNPMYFYISQFRALVYSGTMPDGFTVLAGCGAALVMLAIGMWSFMRSKDRFILYI
ncbi:MAG: ABC transporter permease [Oscillospiraceae bacterium]|nr:ABC transporter permease [Oscillospiraceae bacterium]